MGRTGGVHMTPHSSPTCTIQCFKSSLIRRAEDVGSYMLPSPQSIVFNIVTGSNHSLA